MKKLILFMGSPGTNNIELARYLKITKYPEAPIIDRYETWLNFPEEPYQSNKIEYHFYEEIFKLGLKHDIVIVVAPFVLKEDRDNFYYYLKQRKFNFKFIGIWVERKYEDLQILRKLRLPYRQVSDKDFEYLYTYRRSPTPEEPFDDLIYITREINKGISKSKPYLVDILEILDQI